jgi:translation initiation factor 1 (eIF-1/SUI1)
VTKLEGLEKYLTVEEIEGFVLEMKIKCASGCTLDDEKKGMSEVVIQGEKVKEVIKGLESYGIGSSNRSLIIETVDKLKSKK